MQWRGWERGVRGILGWGVLAVLVLCFLPIVTLLQQLIALDQYATRKDALGKVAKGILNIPFIGGAQPRACDLPVFVAHIRRSCARGCFQRAPCRRTLRSHVAMLAAW
jgi:hypothetical protein